MALKVLFFCWLALDSPYLTSPTIATGYRNLLTAVLLLMVILSCSPDRETNREFSDKVQGLGWVTSGSQWTNSSAVVWKAVTFGSWQTRLTRQQDQILIRLLLLGDNEIRDAETKWRGTGRIPGADFSLRRLITALFWVEVLAVGNVKYAGTSCLSPQSENLCEL